MTKFVKVLSLVLALTMLAVLFVGCGGADGGEDEAAGADTIAVFVPLTGEQKQYGEQISQGILMRIAEYNEANGTDYKVEIFDDKNDSTEAANIANKIVSDDKYFCAMGSYASSCVLAAAPIFQEEGLFFLSPGASHKDVPKVGSYIHTYGINIVLEMQATMMAISERFDNPKLAIIYQNTDHGVLTYETTRDYYPTLGGDLVAAETYVPDSTTDFKSIISKVKEAGAEVVFLSTTYADGAQIILQAADLDTDFQWVGNSQLMQEDFLTLTGELGEGLYASSNMPVFLPSTLNNPEAYKTLSQEQITFLTDFKAFSGLDANGFSVLGYDSAGILMRAVEIAGGTDSDALCAAAPEAFMSTENLLCGKVIEYNAEERTLVRGVGMYMIKDGAFVYAG